MQLAQTADQATTNIIAKQMTDAAEA